jgi:hypothetical protein
VKSKAVIYVLLILAGAAFSTQIKGLPVIGSVLSKFPA